MRLQSLRVSSCFAVLAAIGTWQNLHSVDFSASDGDAVSQNERRFTAIRSALSDRLGSHHGQIGYVSDLDPAGAPGATARFRAQYSLAPFVFAPAQPYALLALDPQFSKYRHPGAIPSANPEWIVGDLSAAGIAIPEGLVMVRDFGKGVVLLRRRPK